MPDAARHPWTFNRVAGFDQVALRGAEDLRRLPELDLKLWAALSVPVQGVTLDPRTLELLDVDGDGRIRAPAILEALRWTTAALQDPGLLLQPGDALPLSALEPKSALLAAAKRIAASAGAPQATSISSADLADPARIFPAETHNGDGVVPPELAGADAPELRRTLAEIVACLGGVPDRSGQPGVDEATSEAFFAAAEAYLARSQAAERLPLPLGEETSAALAALDAIRAKVDDYFVRCRLAGLDPESAAATRHDLEALREAAQGDLSPGSELLAALPLARIEPGRALPLAGDDLNPAWLQALRALRQRALIPLLGEREALSESEWEELLATLEPCRPAALGGAAVAGLGEARLRELVEGQARAEVAALIEADRTMAEEVEALAAVEKLVLFRRDLGTLLHNSVSFRDFYSSQRQAIFQAGTLYLDGRSCELCVRVGDPAQHATTAALSGTYLAYCECTREGSPPFTVAAALTAGDCEALALGRRGVFYDRAGLDYDACVVKVIDHPISLRQAFWAPYKRLAKLAEEGVERISAARDSSLAQQVSGQTAKGMPGAAPPPPAPAAKAAPAAAPFDVARLAGLLAAIGLALGALGASVATLINGLIQLEAWQALLVVLGLLLLISGPSLIVAWLKLRRRSLAPVLDASGWAVNAKIRINIPFGASLTQVAELPPGARRAQSEDPYRDGSGWRWGALIAVGLALLAGVLWASASGSRPSAGGGAAPIRSDSRGS